jgi:hypothetical protein
MKRAGLGKPLAAAGIVVVLLVVAGFAIAPMFR